MDVNMQVHSETLPSQGGATLAIREYAPDTASQGSVVIVAA
jgi:hypothetical protein